MKGFYIFCEESLKKGKYYSNFYGGLLIDKKDFEKANNVLLSKLQDLNIENSEFIDLEIFFDELPDNREKNEEFKKFVYGIQFLPNFRNSKIQIKKTAIYEVDSKKHILI